MGQELQRVVKYRVERLAKFRALPIIKYWPEAGWVSAETVSSIGFARNLIEQCRPMFHPGKYRIIKIETVETVVEEL